MKSPALFLDRDGVINVDHGYVHDKDFFDFIDGIFDLVRAANERSYYVFVVTNQAGIGRGMFSENTFHELSEWMLDQFSVNGCKIDKIYFSPFHPIHGIGPYKRNSVYRKPNPGMFFKAAIDFDVDLPNSVMVGDNLSDLVAAKNALVKNLFLFSKSPGLSGFTVINSLADVVKFI